MSNNTFKSFDRGISTNTKILVLLTGLLLFFSYLFDAVESGFALTAYFALAIVLIIEFFLFSAIKYPKTWAVIKWIIFFVIILLTLIGFGYRQV